MIWPYEKKLLTPLTDNPNAPNSYGYSPIHAAANKGYTEIVKFLTPLTSNPNAPDKVDGSTPIHAAARNGNTEIVKLLAALTDKPNASNDNGRTPFMVTKNEEIRTILKAYKKSAKRKANAEPTKAKHTRKK